MKDRHRQASRVGQVIGLQLMRADGARPDRPLDTKPFGGRMQMVELADVAVKAAPAMLLLEQSLGNRHMGLPGHAPLPVVNHDAAPAWSGCSTSEAAASGWLEPEHGNRYLLLATATGACGRRPRLAHDCAVSSTIARAHSTGLVNITPWPLLIERMVGLRSRSVNIGWKRSGWIAMSSSRTITLVGRSSA